MKRVIRKPLALSLLALVISCIAAFAGGEHYEVYLNKRLLFVKHVSEPVQVMNLLQQTNSADKLVIRYSHCGNRGKNRHIALVNEKGVKVKDWLFADTQDEMSIPVREITALQQRYGILSLSYSSAELPGGRTLASLRNNARSLAAVFFDTGFAVARWLI